jgi:quinoprotein glucose dehydrogenase
VAERDHRAHQRPRGQLLAERDGSDKRLVFLNDGLVRAIDADTGKYIENFSIDVRNALPAGHADTPRPLMTNNPGRIFEDTYIVSLPAGAYDYASAPADIQAYDIRTGALKWVFNVVPRVGEFGSDTWPEKDREKFGGVHNWSEFTIDPETGIAYIPTGTARYDFYGGNRPGNNLFANSMIALDTRTGKRMWHFQTVHHDLWDFDLPNAPKLMTIHKDGKDIPVVIVAAKHGFVFVFDRRTGEPVWPIEERPVPASDVPGEHASPTQPFPTWPQPFARQSFTEADINPLLPEADQAALREKIRGSRNEGLFTPPSVRGTISMPGTTAAPTSAPARSTRSPAVLRGQPRDPGGDQAQRAAHPRPRRAARARCPTAARQLPLHLAGRLHAAAERDGRDQAAVLVPHRLRHEHRQHPLPHRRRRKPATQAQGLTGIGSQAPRGGPVATAGGLLFVGTAGDRTFRARDSATGRCCGSTSSTPRPKACRRLRRSAGASTSRCRSAATACSRRRATRRRAEPLRHLRAAGAVRRTA